ncbi:4Fe-4S binding protein [Desulfosporosinus sp. OT]|uniref:4Fe-4S dicluster domain-containing protein n=1 Tax=Desulfosporosinus sp. OT TaxID=913865 RepID=UPI0009FF2A12|nr:4Fe-4S binding protein [Desulfosporosinus sp. OT]
MQQTGFQLEHCRPNCPKAARDWHNLYDELEIKLTELNLLQILQDKFRPVLNHHLPKVCLAGCPNGCSQPNIKDFGISGYVTPRITDAQCSVCKACERTCLEEAITCQPNGITIDNTRCISCGDCLRVCPSGTLIPGESGWSLRLGGRVGRHPQFAKFAGQVPTDEEVVTWISDIMSGYIKDAGPQERLTHYLNDNKISLVSSVNGKSAHESSGEEFQDQRQ